MMVQIGPYLLMGLITIFGLALAGLVGFMLYSSFKEKKAKEEADLTPRAETVADQIQKQYRVSDERKERRIHTKTGITKTSVKETRSVFTFQEADAENGLSLESEFDNGPEREFLAPDDKN